MYLDAAEEKMLRADCEQSGKRRPAVVVPPVCRRELHHFVLLSRLPAPAARVMAGQVIALTTWHSAEILLRDNG
ncbi:MAG: hypothetical protein IPF60_12935 [Betaproteobacteria bacterium]|nr:hypothetical protein [Betaproteobacteria bacterium]